MDAGDGSPMSPELKRFRPTPEQIALSEERKLKKQKQKQTTPPLVDEEKGKILARTWISLGAVDDPQFTVKLMTWNLLAQCLVRRDLFPTSDCLKAAQREHMIYNEILYHKADIMCLQEVDRLEKLLPVLERSGYAHTYAAGPRKKHGCLVAYRDSLFTKVGEKVVEYDTQAIRTDGDELARIGASFKTKNISSIVALQSKENVDHGLVVATTHLFWHPRYTYERARQAGIMIRETMKFKTDEGRGNWPCILAGDFNFAPNDPAYALLVGQLLVEQQENDIASSRVVHKSIDPTILVGPQNDLAEDDEGAAEKDPDKIITNARPATAADGLLTASELMQLFSSTGVSVRSVYDDGQRRHKAAGGGGPVFGERASLSPETRGFFEPQWTSYTHYWKTVLDYIFVIDPPNQRSRIGGFAQPPETQDLEPGLPRKAVCGSDHVSLCAEVSWTESTT